jgi:hypothetical protein
MYSNFTYIVPDPEELVFFPLDEDSSVDFDFLAIHKKEMTVIHIFLGTPFV